jgi:hypothetical protein
MGGVFNAHIFGRRSRGDREEVRMKLFNEDGSPFSGGEGGAPLDSARFLFSAVGDPGNNMELRTASDSNVIIYSGSWSRVPEAAAEEEGQWYVGAIRPPGPGVYLLMGFVNFFDSSMQSELIKVTMSSEGNPYSSQSICYNGRGIGSTAGIGSNIYEARFAVPMHMVAGGDDYLYASMETGDTFEGMTIPQVYVTAVRLLAL